VSGSTSYTVSARLQITGNYAQVMAQLGRSLTALDRQIGATEQRLVRLAGLFPRFATVVAHSTTAASNSMGSLRAAVANTSGAVSHLRTAMGGMSQTTSGMSRVIQSQNAAMARYSASANTAAVAARNAASAMRALATVPPPPPIPRPPRNTGGGGGGGGGGGVGGGRGPLWRRALGGPATAAGHEVRNLAGAYFGAKAIGELLEEGGKLQTATVIGREQVGPQNAEWFNRLRQKAAETTNLVPGTTEAGNIRAGMSIAGDVKDRDQALELLPTLQHTAQVLATIRPGNTSEGAAAAIARFLSLHGSMVSRTDQGQVDYARYRRDAGELERNFIALPDLKPEEWVAYQQQARTAGQSASDKQMFGGYTAAGILDMTGHRFGTGQAGFVRQFGLGIMTKEQAAYNQEIGLLGKGAKGVKVQAAELDQMRARGELDDEEYQELKKGNAVRYARRDLIAPDLAIADQEAWRRVVFDELKKHKLAGRAINPEDPREADQIANSAGATAVVRGFLSWLFDYRSREANIQRVQDQAPGAGGRIIDESYAGALNSLSGGFRTLLQNLGLSGEVVRLMNDMGQAFRDFAATLREEPGLLEGMWRSVREGFAAFREDLGNFRTVVSGVADVIRAVQAVGQGISTVLGYANDLDRALGTDMPSAMTALRGAVTFVVGDIAGAIAKLREAWDSVKGFFNAARDAAGATSVPGPPAAPNYPMAPDMGLGAPVEIPPRGRVQLNSYDPMPPRNGDVTVQTAVNLDGRTIADVVTRHQGRAVNAPQASTSFADRRMGGLAAGVIG
jgi:hypothetical protein